MYFWATKQKMCCWATKFDVKHVIISPNLLPKLHLGNTFGRNNKIWPQIKDFAKNLAKYVFANLVKYVFFYKLVIKASVFRVAKL